MIVRRKAKTSKTVYCVQCKQRGLRVPAKYISGSEIIPDKPLCQECNDRIHEASRARVGRIRSRALLA